MPTPVRRENSQYLWLRKRVPERYRQIVGRAEVWRSLETGDKRVAMVRCVAQSAALESAWEARLDALARGLPDPDAPDVRPITTLTQKDAVALAGVAYREFLAKHDEDPGSASHWEASLRVHAMHAQPPIKIGLPAQRLRFVYAMDVNAFLRGQDLNLDIASKDKFVRAYIDARVQAEQDLLRHARGDYRPSPDADRFREPTVLTKLNPAVPAIAMFEKYVLEAGLAASSVKRWKPLVENFVAFVGHDDLARVTTGDVVRWKDDLLTKGTANITIRNAYLAALKATLQFAFDQRDSPTNPAAGIKIRVKKKPKTREKGFTADEAKTILRGTLVPATKWISVEMAGARRWVPWICAYTGARVNEITQLRPEDFLVHEGIDVIRIVADAAKTREYRLVPLHDHLLEQGLLKYAASRKKLPLFYNPGRSRGGKSANPQYQKAAERIASWVRELGVDDENVAPNHGWRHRFSTLARAVDMNTDVQNIIQGHAGEKDSSNYGDAWIATAKREISKIPAYGFE
jgi:integrase